MTNLTMVHVENINPKFPSIQVRNNIRQYKKRTNFIHPEIDPFPSIKKTI